MNRKFQRLVALFVVAVMVCSAVPAMAESFREIQRQAQRGNAQAQFELGRIYDDGEIILEEELVNGIKI